MRFCGHCGAQLTSPARAKAERRQLTVLFSDLIGSTGIAERLDPEEYREILRDYQRTVTDEITAHGGHVAQFLGDGILAYFGYPRALEDSADCAVQATLRILQAFSESSQPAAGTPEAVAVRVGIHTGPVVVGDLGDAGSSQQLALGSTPNVAARLQQVAAPGTAVISDATRRLLRSPVELTDLGERSLKGLSTEIRVLAISPAAESTAAEEVTGFEPTPMVNRHPELAAVTSLWEKAKQGRGSVVLLTGEAGVGKSRTVRSFLEKQTNGPGVLFGACGRHTIDTALEPLRGIVHGALGTDPTRPPDEIEEAVARELTRLGLDRPSARALFMSLLDSTAPLAPAIAELTPQLRRRRTLALLRDWLLARAGQGSLVLALEDLHWSDPSTLDWLALVIEDLGSASLLLLFTARPQFQPPWKRSIERLTVDGLESRYVREMVEAIAGDRLPLRWQERLVDQTDGVPLYVEELTRVLLESSEALSAGEDESLDVPTTLKDLLMARLDQLGEGKPLAQWAATLGRSFSPDLLRVVASEVDDFDLQLQKLLTGGLLEVDPTATDGRLHFRQALMQETAYRSLLRADRRDQHRRIAELLLDSAVAHRDAQEIAHHLTESGQHHAAVDWWWQAAEAALARSETHEGIRLLRRGLTSIETRPDAGTRRAEELRFKQAMATALVAVKGYAAAEVEQLHGEVQDLARGLDDRRQNFVALRGVLPFYLVRAQHLTAFDLGEELVVLADEIGDRALGLEAHLALATACFWLARIDRCSQEVAAGLALYDRQRDASHALSYGQDPGVLCHLYSAWSSWWLGRFDRADEHLERALALARSVEHAHSLAMALDHGCSLQLYLRRWEAARELVEEQLAIAAHHGFEMWLAMGAFRSAWLDCLDGDLESGIERLRRGIAAFRATGAEIARPLHLSYLAQAEALAGRHENGLEAIDEALAASEAAEELHYQAELHRIRGRLELAIPGRRTQALDALQRALSTARAQGARALELRAALTRYEAVAGTPDEAAARADLERLLRQLSCNARVPDLEAAEERLRRDSIC